MVLQCGQVELFSRHSTQTIKPHRGQWRGPESERGCRQDMHAFATLRSDWMVFQKKTPMPTPASTAIVRRKMTSTIMRRGGPANNYYRPPSRCSEVSTAIGAGRQLPSRRAECSRSREFVGYETCVAIVRHGARSDWRLGSNSVNAELPANIGLLMYLARVQCGSPSCHRSR